MDDKKVIELKTEQKQEQNTQKSAFCPKLQTNPILQKMIRCNDLSEKMKFKLKDLFR